MVNTLLLERSNTQQSLARDELFQRTEEAFEEAGSTIRVTGSNEYGGADIFSDLDLWAINPDESHEAIMAGREHVFRGIGSLLLTWERPRFAPIGGVHSILLYEGDAPLPLELNVFQASATIADKVYSGYFSEPLFDDPAEKEAFWKRYPWRQEPDDTSPQAKLSHLLCVSYWTTKYLHRGESDKLSWLSERYTQARELWVPGLPDVSNELMHADCPAQYVDIVLRGVERAVEEPAMLRAVHRIGIAAWMFADACEHRGEREQA